MDFATGNYTLSWRFFENDTALGRVFDEAPYLACCSDNKTAARIRPREYALRYPYMQINRPGRVSWLIFDLDHSNPMIWKDAGLPEPNLAVRNRTNSHSHLYYAIPAVLTDEDARPAPIAYMKAVYEAYAKRLKADLCYSGGPVAKTPGHPWWDTSEFHSHVYDLGELADYVELEVRPWRGKPKLDDVEHSRHCILFEELRFYAYSIVNQQRDTGSYDQFVEQLEAFAHNHNNFLKHGFSRNLLLSSLRATIKSVARWTWFKYHGGGNRRLGVMGLDPTLPLKEKQSLAAKRTHDVRHKATEAKIRGACAALKALGRKLSQVAIAEFARVTRQTVAKHAHILKEPLRNAVAIQPRDVKHGVHQIPAAPAAPFGFCPEVNNDLFERGCAMPHKYELVKGSPGAPKVMHFEEDGITAYSCLIPYDREHCQIIHFVSGADGDEYGQFPNKEQAVHEAVRVVARRKKLEPKNE